MRKGEHHNFYYLVQICFDGAGLVLTFFLAMCFGKQAALASADLADGLFLLYLLIGWYFASIRYSLYPPVLHHTLLKDLFACFNVIVVQVLLCILFSFTFKEQLYGRSFVFIYALGLFVLMPMSKIGVRKFFYYYYGKGRFLKRVVVVGDGVSGKRFYHFILQNPLYGYEMVKYIPGSMIVRGHRQAMAKLQTMASGLSSLGRIDEVFVTEAGNASYDTREIINILSAYAVQVRLIPKVASYANGQLQVTMLGSFPLISMVQEPLEDVFNQFLKRGFDLLFSTLVLVFVCSWLLPLIAFLIKLESKGPVFFMQERWGKRNKPFKCYKFRSMYTDLGDSDEKGTFRQARKGDRRITKIGRFLRKTNLDEFPQFFNVFRGEMSVVGPRPHATLMNLEALHAINKYLVRHQCKPGITGWAQVNGLRGESDNPEKLEERVAYDVWYIQHWTFWLDMKIIFLTFWKMLVGDKNAY
ncbi:undecaprenyl-phosphate glucose phosphotransferase [Olivibacter sitiensis]|uniref:undecaprenyl-phosphate glucose phosphotransferase n=1 Tax=Olivibacter sitiensis TaxID=376470 RepID=UPI0003FD7C8D|nr:undecaprenyl-phosphate glucose phosphotransferase [Olivibacter sitiensis]